MSKTSIDELKQEFSIPEWIILNNQILDENGDLKRY